jgi:hypothetical protein
MSRRRVRAIVHKEFQEYRRNGNIIATMAVVPLLIVIAPLVDMCAAPVRSPCSSRAVRRTQGPTS